MSRKTSLLERNVPVDFVDPSLLILLSGMLQEHLVEILPSLNTEDGDGMAFSLDFQLAMPRCLWVTGL